MSPYFICQFDKDECQACVARWAIMNSDDDVEQQKDVRSPDARLSLAHLSLARLRLNDGAKLWVSFKLCFKTNDFYGKYWRILF